MRYFFYNFLLLLFSPFYIWRVIWKNRGWDERFGNIIPQVKKKQVIWIHAVSVGEVVACMPLVSLINKELTDSQVMLSTVTRTGREMAKKIIGESTILLYFPFDFPFVVKKLLKRISPKVIILVETELWPNFLRYSEYFKIPVILVNGRISPSAFRGYMRIRPFFKHILDKVTVFCMQTEEDRHNLILLGADPKKVIVTGNTKFDSYDLSSFRLDKKPLKNWNIQGRSPVIVAGSTHAGEEKTILKIFHEIEKKFPEMLLILAPRHPERAPEVEDLIKEEGYSYVKRTEMGDSRVEERIILVDTIGELLQIYATSDIVFVGGSLLPKGGHNPLEPASFAKPIITGPYTFNFEEITNLLKKDNAIIQLTDEKNLKEALIELLSNAEKREKLGKNAQKVVQSNQGATRRNLEIIERYI